MEKKSYTVGETAKLLRVSDSTVSNYIERKALSATRIDRGPWRISSDSIAKLLERNKIPHIVSVSGDITLS